MIDHDRLFKELLTTFFVEFLELLLPDVAAYLERDSVQFLDKEVFTDVTAGERYEADLVVQARFQEEDSFFLIHLEHQTRRFGLIDFEIQDRIRQLSLPQLENLAEALLDFSDTTDLVSWLQRLSEPSNAGE